VTIETRIRTGRREIDDLVPLVRSFLEHDVLELSIDGGQVRGYRTPDARSVWIRDHSDMMRGFRHFERDVTSAVAHFAETQSARGRVFDYFTTFPEKPPGERENWTKYVRVPVEADVEYRFVKAAWLAWQATGDDGWIRRMLPHMERALAYIEGHPWYWDGERGLVRRPYTIDTWDFAYTAGRHDWLQFQVTPDTFWGVMHGDNSGYYEAFRIVAALWRRFGDAGRASGWDARADDLRARMNRLCWNGRFYTHFVKLTPVAIDGADENAQLSLSNPMDVNRGVADHEQAASIIREYQRRRAEGRAFAEWFSIDPPFPDGIFGDPRLVAGAYCNGGIMPLVGGELAHAAFEHGFETYGVDVLRRYFELAGARGESYLWYFPDGSPSSPETSTSPEATPTDGWGSSAMLWALIEGLAGVVDRGCGYDTIALSPRWAAAGVDEAEVEVGYAASGHGVRYRYRNRGDVILLEVEPVHDAGPAAGEGLRTGEEPRNGRTAIRAHVLLPPGTAAQEVRRDGRPIPFDSSRVESSVYVGFAADLTGAAAFTIGVGTGFDNCATRLPTQLSKPVPTPMPRGDR